MKKLGYYFKLLTPFIPVFIILLSAVLVSGSFDTHTGIGHEGWASHSGGCHRPH
ncbi:MAG: hypothetical protein OEZ01_14185 [Candidatus Heimdallarchaeota archaeon]|nr:hypothetical protein [Candidatus Heimdallarchaeota archaeon]MDH5647156.1 hypothetical protein [Candidatus Heimdallarchaeota archaeon]